MNSVGPSTDPWGTPLVTFSHPDAFPLITTRWRLSLNQASIHLQILLPIPRAFTFSTSRLWGTLSNALLKSRYKTSTGLPSSTYLVTSSKNFNKFVRHDFPFVKPCCVSRISFFEYRWSKIASLTNVSNRVLYWPVMSDSLVYNSHILSWDLFYGLLLHWQSSSLQGLFQLPCCINLKMWLRGIANSFARFFNMTE